MEEIEPIPDPPWAELWPERWRAGREGLVRMAVALVHDEHAGEDAVQSATLAALRRPAGSVRGGWMARAVHGRALDVLRRRRVRAEHEAWSEPGAPPARPDEIAERLECHALLSKAVLELEEPYRTTVYRRYFEDRTPAAIARATGVPVKTVKTRLARGLALLRARLARSGGPGGADWRSALCATFGIERSLTISALGGAFGTTGIMTKKLLLVAAAAALALGIVLYAPRGSEPHTPRTRDAQDAQDAALAEPEVVRTQGEALDLPRERIAAAAAPAKDQDVVAGALLVRVRFADGAVAPDVQVAVVRGGFGVPWRSVAVASTDASGTARFDGLEPGEVRLRPLRALGEGENEALVRGGETTEVVLTLPEGLDVEGRVVDGAGRPVAGAEIWVASGLTDWLGGEVVARSDAEGRFSVRQVRASTSLGAIAEGFAPSRLVDLELLDASAPPVVIELVVEELGGALAGTVRATDGTPIAGAKLAIGGVPSFIPMRVESRGLEEIWTPRVVVSAEDGRYRAAGLLPGTHPVEVQADGHAIWKGEVTIRPEVETALDPVLSDGFRVQGFVRGPLGEPVPGAVVRAYDERIRLDFIQTGQFDYDSAFGFVSAVADAEGRFALQHLPVGEADLHASPPPPTRQLREMGSVMRAHTRLVGAEGATLEWNPVLDEGLVIAGRVEYSDGVPMTDVFVSARNEDDGVGQSLVNDSKGRFRFLNLENAPYSLSVQLWRKPEGAGPLEMLGVRPGGGEVVLTADFPAPQDLAPGTVSGIVRDDGKRLGHEGALGVFLQTGPGSWRTCQEVDGMGFRFDEVDPGRVRLGLWSGESPIYFGEWFELLPGEQRDVGTLVTEPAGAVVIELVRDDTTREVEPTVYLHRDGDLHAHKAEALKRERIPFDNVTPGLYDVDGFGEGVARIQGQVEVRAGESTTFRAALRAAVRCPFEVRWPEGAELGQLALRVVEDDGTEHWQVTETRPAALPRPYVRSPALPLGKYTLTVETPRGLSKTVPFEVTSLAEEREPVRVDLR